MERVASDARGDRGKETRPSCTAEPATAGDERLAALTPAVSLVQVMVISYTSDRRWCMVDFQAIDHCSDADDRSHSPREHALRLIHLT